MSSAKSQPFYLAGVMAMIFAAPGALAQTTAAPAAAQPQANAALKEVVVTGVRRSLRDALQAKRASKLVTETISSKDIGALPDVTIADELARLPGLNSSRDRGNDSQISIRGLGPRLVLGLVNGREVASSEPDRNVRWEIYPSEDVSSVTVYKSQSANLIAGGVSGTVDIRTLRPLDYVGPSLTLRAGGLVNSSGIKIPNYSGVGTRDSAQYVLKRDNILGLAVGGSYQQQRNGYDSFQGWGYNTSAPGDNPPTLNGKQVFAPWGAQTEATALTETRWSTTADLQWKPTAEWDINYDLLYSDVKIDEDQFQQWYGNWGDWGGTLPDSTYSAGQYTLAGQDIVGANVGNYKTQVTNVIAKYTEDKSLLATGLNGKYHTSDLTLTFDGSYSRAERNNTWQALEWNNYPQNVTFNTAAGVVPSITTPDNPASPTNQSFAGAGLTGPQHLLDQLGAFQADAKYELNDGLLSGIEGGVRYSDRTKSFSSLTGGTVNLVGTPNFSEFSSSGAGFTAPSMLYANYDQIASLDLANAVQDKTQYWHVHESDAEAYAMADLAGQMAQVPYDGTVGVRLVDVSTTSAAYQNTTFWNGTENETSYTPYSVGEHYFRALPSLNLNFNLNPDLLLRVGLARVMSRPPLDELRASTNLSYYPPSYLQGTAGNPKLMPFMANQADLSLEYYFHPEALVALAGYYKDVSTNIGYAQYQANIGGTNYTITGPVNGKGGRIDGLELTLQTPFYFISGLDHFGIYSNAAVVDSSIKELTPTTNPFPAVGLTKFTSELDFWYSDHGIDARIALKHHTPYTVIFGWDASVLTRLDSETTLGASVSYAITPNLSVRVQADNLTNQAARYYYNNDPNELARYEKYGVSYLTDLTYKF